MVDRKPEFYDKCCCQENQIPPPVSRYTRWSKANHSFIPSTRGYILEPVACFAATWKLGKLFAKDKQGAGLDNWNHFIVASQN